MVPDTMVVGSGSCSRPCHGSRGCRAGATTQANQGAGLGEAQSRQPPSLPAAKQVSSFCEGLLYIGLSLIPLHVLQGQSGVSVYVCVWGYCYCCCWCHSSGNSKAMLDNRSLQGAATEQSLLPQNLHPEIVCVGSLAQTAKKLLVLALGICLWTARTECATLWRWSVGMGGSRNSFWATLGPQLLLWYDPSHRKQSWKGPQRLSNPIP